jgi:5-methyltetrahydropteroyltriglutamate--homocysteine methyltransferase
MRHSAERILTTHTGSLIRPERLLDFIGPMQRGETYDHDAHARCLAECVAEVVREQVEAGIDVPSDGEFGKSISWSQYALERLGGFERRPAKPGANPFARGADRERFRDFYAELDAKEGYATVSEAVCVAPITYQDMSEVDRDIANFKAALKAAGAYEGFLPVAAPASVVPDRRNEYYKDDDACLEAIAEAMRTEYKAITDAGLIVQLDDARTAVTFDRMVPPATLADYRNWVARHVELLNHALRGIPREQVRYHVCWGSWPGPHTTDVPLDDIIDLVMKLNVGALVIEGANPRHEHEWQVWGKVKFPDDRVLVHGVVSHATNVVEHPELVAERLVRLARLVGRERVLAGTDCGFAQGPFYRRVHPSIMWAKLGALVEGARIASRALWGKAA